MIQRIENEKSVHIIDTETEWNGVGYPYDTKAVWQYRLDNEKEMPLYEDKHIKLKEKFEKEKKDKLNEI